VGKVSKSKAKEINLKDYAKYILREGTVVEKREFLGCIKNKFTLSKKTITIKK